MYFCGFFRKSTISTSSLSASSMPATSSNVTRLASPGATRRAVERPKPPSTPPDPPPTWRRMSQINRPTRRIVGPKPRNSVARKDRPLSAGSALTTTPLDSSCFVRSVVSTNDGTSVLKRSTFFALPPGGVNDASFLRSPWIVSPCEEISETLPALTCWRKNGEYGICVRCSGPPVMNATTTFSARSARITAIARRPRGNIGGFGGGGAPRPSGAGSTRQPLRSSVSGGRCGLDAAGDGSGTVSPTVARPAGLLHQRADVGLERRVADRGGVHARDLDALAGGEARDGAQHREAVIAVRGDRAAAQAAAPAHREAVVGRLDVGAERAQAVDDGGDPVALLDPQLLRAADHRLPLREAAEKRYERQLVDRERDLFGLDDRAVQLARRDLEVADRIGVRDRLAGVVLERAVDAPAHPLRDADEARARPVHARAADRHARARDDQRRGDRERRRRRVAGDGDGVEREIVGGLDRHRRAVAANRDAGGGEHALGVVAGWRRLDDGRRPVRVQRGEGDRRLDLRAGDRQLVGDPAQPRARDRERRESLVARLDGGAPGGERDRDAVDGTAADRLVAVEQEGAPLLRREPAGQQAHERAGVADVDRPV